jgi:hypothetical protein
MTVSSGVTVRGLREISASMAKLGPEARKEWRAEERAIAEPVKRDIETNAPQRLTRIGRWSKMRIGVTQNVVYVAPREHGRRGRGFRTGAQERSDQLFAGRLMGWVMEPALRQNETRIEHDVERLIDRVCDRFNQGAI